MVAILDSMNLVADADLAAIVTRRLLDLISQRFVHVLMDIDATSFQQLIPRLAKLLLEKADGDFVHNMTHKELAQHLRVIESRQLQPWGN